MKTDMKRGMWLWVTDAVLISYLLIKTRNKKLINHQKLENVNVHQWWLKKKNGSTSIQQNTTCRSKGRSLYNSLSA